MVIVLTWVAVALAGGLGAVLRLLIDGRVSARLGSAFPYGTTLINLSGSAALGVLTGLAASPGLLLVIGTGALGGYTTFSTWMFEAQRLGEDQQGARSAASLVVGLSGGLVCAVAGRALVAVL